MIVQWDYLLGRASLLLSVSCLAVLWLARWQPMASPRWHRAAWTLVLLQGVLLFPGIFPVNMPNWTAVVPLVSSNADRLLPSSSSDGLLVSSATDVLLIPSRSDVLDVQPLDTPGAVQATVSERSDAAIRGAWPRGDQDWQEFFAAPVSVLVQPGKASSEDGQELAPPIATESTVSVMATEAQPIPQNDVRAGREFVAYDRVRQRTHQSSPSVGDALRRVPVFKEPVSGVQREQSGQIADRFVALLPELAFGIWLAGVGFCGLVLLLSYLLLLWSLRRCRLAPSRWARELAQLCHEVGFKGRVRLETHPRLGPFVCWTPRGARVVVPVRLWSRLTAPERLAVLHHELCHLRRGDLWKSLVARLVVNLHWFNPWAWLAGCRFDESAEWLCDAMMAREAPSRTAPLAKALLAAARSAEVSRCGALAVSGGTVFRRMRRLLEGTQQGDRTMRKIYWMLVLTAAALLAFLRPQHTMLGNSAQEAGQMPSATETIAQAQESRSSTSGDESEVPTPQTFEADGRGLNGPANAEGNGSISPPEDTLEASRLQERLDDLAQRIVVGESEVLSRFVKILKTEAGRVVIADRMALVEQNAARQEAASTSLENFLAGRFQESDNGLTVKPEYVQEMDRYVRKVERGTEAVQLMVPVFKEVAESLVSDSEAAGILKRFLLHEGSCAAVYYRELRSRLHPDVQEVEGQLEELIVRTAAGHYLIRPARRAEAAQQVSQLQKRSSLLDEMHQELCTWADEMVGDDESDKRVQQMLRSRPFAAFLAFQTVPDRSHFTSDDLEGIFARLEEATDDTAAGLKLNPETDAARSLREDVERFSAMWQQREVLRESLARLLDLIEERDELHRRFKTLMQSEDAFIALAVNIDYAGRSAPEAVREWLSSRVTRNEMGRYELTVESPDQLIEELRNYFTEFREIRRRGRSIDLLAARLEDQTLRSALQSYLGKLLLRDLVEQAVVTADLDPLQLWIDEHFEEQAEGLVLRDGAEGAIAQVIEQAEQLEAQLKQVDF